MRQAVVPHGVIGSWPLEPVDLKKRASRAQTAK